MGKKAQRKKVRKDSIPKAMLTVRVHDAGGNTLEAIRVELKDGRDSVGERVTNDEGEAVFADLEQGIELAIWVNGENTKEEVMLEKAVNETEVEYDGEYEPVEPKEDAVKREEEDEGEASDDEGGFDSEEEGLDFG